MVSPHSHWLSVWNIAPNISVVLLKGSSSDCFPFLVGYEFQDVQKLPGIRLDERSKQE